PSKPVPDAAAAATPSRATPDLCVRTLGPFEVEVRGHAVASWPYAKPKELLAFLLLRPHGRTRPEIGAALWPEASPAQVRNSFHVTMHHVRRRTHGAGGPALRRAMRLRSRRRGSDRGRDPWRSAVPRSPQRPPVTMRHRPLPGT